MATVQDLKRRIRSVGNTQKITKAFELVASARLRRAQTRIEALRPYAARMLELMRVAPPAPGAPPPLGRRVAGACGGPPPSPRLGPPAAPRTPRGETRRGAARHGRPWS